MGTSLEDEYLIQNRWVWWLFQKSLKGRAGLKAHDPAPRQIQDQKGVKQRPSNFCLTTKENASPGIQPATCGWSPHRPTAGALGKVCNRVPARLFCPAGRAMVTDDFQN